MVLSGGEPLSVGLPFRASIRRVAWPSPRNRIHDLVTAAA